MKFLTRTGKPMPPVITDQAGKVGSDPVNRREFLAMACTYGATSATAYAMLGLPTPAAAQSDGQMGGNGQGEPNGQNPEGQPSQPGGGDDLANRQEALRELMEDLQRQMPGAAGDGTRQSLEEAERNSTRRAQQHQTIINAHVDEAIGNQLPEVTPRYSLHLSTTALLKVTGESERSSKRKGQPRQRLPLVFSNRRECASSGNNQACRDPRHRPRCSRPVFCSRW